MPIPLEDNFSDIISKAQRGLAISDTSLASRSDLPVETVQQLRAGVFDPAAAEAVAPALGLNAKALLDIAQNAYAPADMVPFDGLAQFNTPFGDMTVNAYLAWDPATKDAVAFDTGGDCSDMLDTIKSKALHLRAILLTHTHGDHIFDLDRLKESTHASAYVSSREPLDGAAPIDPGWKFTAGALKITARLTWGHSRGGITWVIEGLPRPIAVVGDALFAGSMGGGMASYADALRTNREEIFSLPDNTIICPGHGPMTSVGEERKGNPFFANVADPS